MHYTVQCIVYGIMHSTHLQISELKDTLESYKLTTQRSIFQT